MDNKLRLDLICKQHGKLKPLLVDQSEFKEVDTHINCPLCQSQIEISVQSKDNMIHSSSLWSSFVIVALFITPISYFINPLSIFLFVIIDLYLIIKFVGLTPFEILDSKHSYKRKRLYSPLTTNISEYYQ